MNRLLLEHSLCAALSPYKSFFDSIQRAGGHPIVVGGAVRDALMGLPIRDLDVEVFGLEVGAFETLLAKHGKPIGLVGKSYGIYAYDSFLELSLPRTEKKVALGHQGFEVSVDPFLPFEKAVHRRDLTLNAIGYDVIQGELLDPVGGLKDMENCLLKCVSPETFIEDPLRGLRVAQFISRFGFLPDEELQALCSKLNLSELSFERIGAELNKLFWQGTHWDLALDFLEKTHLNQFLIFSHIACEWHIFKQALLQILTAQKNLPFPGPELSLWALFFQCLPPSQILKVRGILERHGIKKSVLRQAFFLGEKTQEMINSPTHPILANLKELAYQLKSRDVPLETVSLLLDSQEIVLKKELRALKTLWSSVLQADLTPIIDAAFLQHKGHQGPALGTLLQQCRQIQFQNWNLTSEEIYLRATKKEQ